MEASTNEKMDSLHYESDSDKYSETSDFSVISNTVSDGSPTAIEQSGTSQRSPEQQVSQEAEESSSAAPFLNKTDAEEAWKFIDNYRDCMNELREILDSVFDRENKDEFEDMQIRFFDQLREVVESAGLNATSDALIRTLQGKVQTSQDEKDALKTKLEIQLHEAVIKLVEAQSEVSRLHQINTSCATTADNLSKDLDATMAQVLELQKYNNLLCSSALLDKRLVKLLREEKNKHLEEVDRLNGILSDERKSSKEKVDDLEQQTIGLSNELKAYETELLVNRERMHQDEANRKILEKEVVNGCVKLMENQTAALMSARQIVEMKAEKEKIANENRKAAEEAARQIAKMKAKKKKVANENRKAAEESARQIAEMKAEKEKIASENRKAAEESALQIAEMKAEKEKVANENQKAAEKSARQIAEIKAEKENFANENRKAAEESACQIAEMKIEKENIANWNRKAAEESMRQIAWMRAEKEKAANENRQKIDFLEKELADEVAEHEDFAKMLEGTIGALHKNVADLTLQKQLAETEARACRTSRDEESAFWRAAITDFKVDISNQYVNENAEETKQNDKDSTWGNIWSGTEEIEQKIREEFGYLGDVNGAEDSAGEDANGEDSGEEGDSSEEEYLSEWELCILLVEEIEKISSAETGSSEHEYHRLKWSSMREALRCCLMRDEVTSPVGYRNPQGKGDLGTEPQKSENASTSLKNGDDNNREAFLRLAFTGVKANITSHVQTIVESETRRTTENIRVASDSIARVRKMYSAKINELMKEVGEFNARFEATSKALRVSRGKEHFQKTWMKMQEDQATLKFEKEAGEHEEDIKKHEQYIKTLKESHGSELEHCTIKEQVSVTEKEKLLKILDEIEASNKEQVSRLKLAQFEHGNSEPVNLYARTQLETEVKDLTTEKEKLTKLFEEAEAALEEQVVNAHLAQLEHDNSEAASLSVRSQLEDSLKESLVQYECLDVKYEALCLQNQELKKQTEDDSDLEFHYLEVEMENRELREELQALLSTTEATHLEAVTELTELGIEFVETERRMKLAETEKQRLIVEISGARFAIINMMPDFLKEDLPSQDADILTVIEKAENVFREKIKDLDNQVLEWTEKAGDLECQVQYLENNSSFLESQDMSSAGEYLETLVEVPQKEVKSLREKRTELFQKVEGLEKEAKKSEETIGDLCKKIEQDGDVVKGLQEQIELQREWIGTQQYSHDLMVNELTEQVERSIDFYKSREEYVAGLERAAERAQAVENEQETEDSFDNGTADDSESPPDLSSAEAPSTNFKDFLRKFLQRSHLPDYDDDRCLVNGMPNPLYGCKSPDSKDQTNVEDSNSHNPVVLPNLTDDFGEIF